jgi:hypothetical protein
LQSFEAKFTLLKIQKSYKKLNSNTKLPVGNISFGNNFQNLATRPLWWLESELNCEKLKCVLIQIANEKKDIFW